MWLLLVQPVLGVGKMVDRETSISKRKWEFRGTSRMIPVTRCGVLWPVTWTSIVLPSGSSLPKTLAARDSERTIALGSRRAVRGIALHQGEREDVEERSVGREDLGLFEGEVIALPEDDVAEGAGELGQGLDLRILVADGLGQDPGRPELMDLGVALVRPVGGDPVDPVGVPVEAVVAELVDDVEHDENAGRDADGQAHDVDESVALMPGQVPQGDLQVVLEHGGLPRKERRNPPCNGCLLIHTVGSRRGSAGPSSRPAR